MKAISKVIAVIGLIAVVTTACKGMEPKPAAEAPKPTVSTPAPAPTPTTPTEDAPTTEDESGHPGEGE